MDNISKFLFLVDFLIKTWILNDFDDALSILKELTPFGKIINSKEKEVDESMLNEKHSIYYWGPGCNPSLVET